MDKILIVAIREFSVNVRRGSFWFMTLGFPLGLALIMLVTGAIFLFKMPTRVIVEGPASQTLGVVDDFGLAEWVKDVPQATKSEPEIETDFPIEGVELPEWVKRTLARQATKVEHRGVDPYAVFTDWETGREALENGEIAALLAIPDDFLQSFELRLLLPENDGRGTGFLQDVETLLRDRILSEKLSDEDLETVDHPLRGMKVTYLKEKPERDDDAGSVLADAAEKENVDTVDKLKSKILRFVMPLIFMIALTIVVLSSGDRLLRGLMEEKQNRVIELLLSSLTANQMMAGKVFGLGLIGLLQFGIWMTLGFLPASFLFTFFKLDLAMIGIFLIFFLLGYFLLATFILGVGSLGNNIQEANQLVAIFIILSISPMMLSTMIVSNPEGVMAKTLTFFPFSAPFMVISRYAADAISGLEVLGAALVLVLTIIISIRLCAKIFRAGILMTGKVPTPLQIWRVLRAR